MKYSCLYLSETAICFEHKNVTLFLNITTKPLYLIDIVENIIIIKRCNERVKKTKQICNKFCLLI